MKLNYAGIQDRSAWSRAGIVLPTFDWPAMRASTAAAPTWVHFGAGNIFRAFIALLQQDLLEQGLVSGGIVAADTSSFDNISHFYQPFDNMSIAVTLSADGSAEKKVVASVAEALRAKRDCPDDLRRLGDCFRADSLQMVSFTITEKGYALQDIDGRFLPAVASDFQKGPHHCTHTMSIAASLLFDRFQAGGRPIAVVSMDNCSHNGDKLRASILTVAEHWAAAGFIPKAFTTWLLDDSKVSFPWTMIDKITPLPSRATADMLTAAGVEDMVPIKTPRGASAAPYVNAEGPQYLVIEDRFPNGRPPLEQAGVYMTDQATVDRTERMKVTACLNPLHTALAVYGCLLRCPTISAAIEIPELRHLVEKIGYDEGLPVVVSPKIIDPAAFLRVVLEQRFPNPFIPDTPQRIASDTSQKIPIRYGETLKAYAVHPVLRVTDLTYIPLAIAGWLRYLLAVDDWGAPMPCSSDPMLPALQAQLAEVKLGKPDSVDSHLSPILSNPVIFGSDLVELGLSEKIEAMVRSLVAGPGAVRDTLKFYL